MKQKLTQRLVDEYIRYDFETGKLYWKKSRSSVAIKDEEIKSCYDGYILFYFFGNRLRAHRLIYWMCTGKLVKTIDHINGIRNDNRFENLREVTVVENARNASLSVANKTGVTGVCWCKWHNAYKASMTKEIGKRNHIGYFTDFDDAVAAVKKAYEENGYHAGHGKTPKQQGYLKFKNNICK